MVSILTVPEQKSSGTVTVALTPADTREWLEKLTLDEFSESLTRIYHELYDLNRVPMKPGARLRLLEPYRAPVQKISQNIEIGLEANEIPFQKNQTVLAEMCRRVAAEMAYGYKSVVLDLAKMIRSSRGNKDLCTAIQRSILYLSQTIYRSALYYTSQPPGTWIEIHSLFSYARKLGVEKIPVKDALNRPRPKNSISHAYQQAILFGVSDPYRLSVPVIGKLYRYLDRWASLVEITEYESAPDSRCQFIVEPDQDQPALAFDQKLAPKPARSMLLVDARSITNVAHSHWHEVRKGSKPKPNGLGETFFNGNSIDMLEQVIRSWGISPRRRYPRNSISGPYQLALGIGNSVYCINEERVFKGASARQKSLGSTVTGAIVEPSGSPTQENQFAQVWTGLNESILGVCLCVDLSRKSAVQIRIGEVVAYRTDRGNARWSAGLVRWARVTDNELRAGIQQFGADCRPAIVSPISVPDGGGNGFKPGIFVPGDSDGKRQPSLIAPAGTFRSKRKIIVDDGTVTRIALAGNLLERSPCYDWFEFSLTDQQPNP